jgi:hypothetical protein
MKPNMTTNLLLSTIALLLFAIVLRPLRSPQSVQAQSPDVDFYFEPGTYLLRAPDNSQQVYGKVVVDLRTGRIWGFPTYTPQPYPSDPVYNKALVSHPFLIGRFALEETRRYIKDDGTIK